MSVYFFFAIFFGVLLIIDSLLIFIFRSRITTLLLKSLFEILSFFTLLFAYFETNNEAVFVAMAGNCVGLVRDIIFLLQEKYKAFNSIIFLILIEIGFISIVPFSWRGIICLLPAIASLVSTYALYIKHYLTRTWLALISMATYVVYYGILLPGSNFLTILNFTSMFVVCVSCVIGLINYYIKRRNSACARTR